MDDFEVIYNGDEIDHLICKHCNKRVERGIVNVSAYWMDCLKRVCGLIITKE